MAWLPLPPHLDDTHLSTTTHTPPLPPHSSALALPLMNSLYLEKMHSRNTSPLRAKTEAHTSFRPLESIVNQNSLCWASLGAASPTHSPGTLTSPASLLAHWAAQSACDSAGSLLAAHYPTCWQK